MKNFNKDFKSVLRCLHNNPEGIECLAGDESFLFNLKPYFSVLTPTKNRPDAYAVINDSVLLLEHFQFDNSQVVRKGSKQNLTAAETDRKIDKLLSKEDFAVLNEYIEKCGIYYVGNLRKQFDAHAKKIYEYKKDIQTETNQVFSSCLMGFIIEDASILGSVYFDNGLKYVDLVFSKEFLDLFEQTTNLDFVIFAMTGNEENKVLSFISRKTIEEHRKNQIEVSKIQEFSFKNSICASGIFYVPKNKIKK